MLMRKYPRVNDFTDAKDSQSWPEFPGIELDQDFNKTHTSIDALNAFLSSIARFGPTIKSGSVTKPATNPEVFSGLRRPIYWMPNTLFRAGQALLADNSYYFTHTTHTSSNSFAADVAAGRWTIIIGQGFGSPVTADNFADITDKARARFLLGIRSMGLANAGIELVEYRQNSQNDARFLRRSLNLADLDDPAEFIANLGLAGFVLSNRAEGMLGPQGVFGRESSNGHPLSYPIGMGLRISGTTLTHKPAVITDLSPTSDGVVVPTQFRALMNESVFSFVGDTSIENVNFAVLRLDRTARARHAPPPNIVQPTITPGGWRTRPLSEVSTMRVGARVASNRLFLPAGAYFIECTTSTYSASGPVSSRVRLKRVAINVAGSVQPDPKGDDSPEVLGTCGYDSNNGLSMPDVIRGLLITEYDSYFELQQRVSSAVIAGSPSNLDTSGSGARELYSEVRVFRLDGGSDEDFGPFAFRDLVYKVGSSAILRTLTPTVGRQIVYKVGACVLLKPEGT